MILEIFALRYADWVREIVGGGRFAPTILDEVCPLSGQIIQVRSVVAFLF